MRVFRGVVLVGALGLGCGGVVASGGAGGSGAGGGGAVPGSPSCEAASDALAARLGGGTSSCTVVVRVSSSLDLLGYAVFCGDYVTPDESAARDQLQADTGLKGYAIPSPVAGLLPIDEFVFALNPTIPGACTKCGDGMIGAVAARSGLTVFGARASWSSIVRPEVVVYPPTWKPASDLGAGCTPPGKPPAARGFDFSSTAWGAELDDASVHSALGAVWNTALPAAYANSQPVRDAVVLRYKTALESHKGPEYAVLLNSGWPG